MEDSEEDEARVLVEEDEVIELCNVIIVEYWGITIETFQTFSRNVPIVLLQITQLKTVHS